MSEPHDLQDIKEEQQDWQEWRQHVDATLQYLIAELPQEKRMHLLQKGVRWAKNLLPKMPSEEDMQDLLHRAEQRITSMENEKNTLLQNLDALQNDKDRAIAERDELHNNAQRYNAAIAALESDNAALRQDMETACKKLEEVQKKSITDPAPATWEKQLAALSADMQTLTKKYFETMSVHIFLVQCGQFNRLVQFWEACKRHVLEQESVPDGMSKFLEQLLALYNSATPQGEARIIATTAGSTFDFDVCQRVGADGTRVQTLLLPGLCNPAGKVLHKALVTLVR